MREERWGGKGRAEAKRPWEKGMTAAGIELWGETCWEEVWRRLRNYTICFFPLLLEKNEWWNRGRGKDRERKRTSRWRGDRIRAGEQCGENCGEAREKKWLGMREEVWCIPELFACCVLYVLFSSLPFPHMHPSINVALERCHVESTHLQTYWFISLVRAPNINGS